MSNSIERVDAPSGATHKTLKGTYMKHAAGDWFEWLHEWVKVDSGVHVNVNQLTEISGDEMNPKKLTQAVFEGLPSEYQWAAVDGYNGAACAYILEPSVMDGDDQFSFAGGDYLFVGDDYDATDWQNSLIERQDVPTKADIDWSKAPAGATHSLIKDSGVAWFKFKDDLSFPNTWKDGEWKNVRLPTRKLTPKPAPKRLTQAVFDGLPPEYRWAYLDKDGDPVIFCDLEAEFDARFPDHQPDCYEDGLELATWMDSVLWRKESIHDVARSIEAARVEEQKFKAKPCPHGCVAATIEQASMPYPDGDPRYFETSDVVNNPAHYTTGGIECIDAMQAMLSRDEFIGYLRGNIFKYQWRYKHKNGVEDLRKADWYAQRLIKVEGEK